MLTLVAVFLTTLFFMGLIGRTKSICSGRQGPGLFQPLYDMARLFRKGSVYSRTTSIVFQIAPSIYCASLLCALLTLPFGPFSGLLSFDGDFLVFACTLAIGKFFLILAALDTGSSFEGMGANRETLYSMLVEPTFFALMASLALLTGQTSFGSIYATLTLTGSGGYALGAVAAYLLVQVAMIENSRMPVDDPRTHLELTMIHEVMVLDYSGFDLAMIQYGTAVKFALYGTLIANFFIPANGSMGYSLALFFAIQILFAITVGLLESFRARLRMRHNPQFIFSLVSIAILIFLSVLTLNALHRTL